MDGLARLRRIARYRSALCRRAGARWPTRRIAESEAGESAGNGIDHDEGVVRRHVDELEADSDLDVDVGHDDLNGLDDLDDLDHLDHCARGRRVHDRRLVRTSPGSAADPRSDHHESIDFDHRGRDHLDDASAHDGVVHTADDLTRDRADRWSRCSGFRAIRRESRRPTTTGAA